MQAIITILQSTPLGLVLLLFLLLNVVSYGLMVHDKRQTWYGRPRIGKRALLFVAGIGGSAGMKIGQKVLKHMELSQPFASNLNMIILLQALIVGGGFLYANDTTRTFLIELRESRIAAGDEDDGPRIFGPASR